MGSLALLVDVGVLYLAKPALGVYGGRVLSFLAAATFTWWLNRIWTFATAPGLSWMQLLREWLHYLALMGVGGAVNYLSYAGLVAWQGPTDPWPLLGVALGSVTGMGVNYLGASRLLDRQRPSA